ncbi:hypothetical protein ACLK17_13795 [Escherichia coli]
MVRVEEGTLKGDVADILPYASSLWVGDGDVRYWRGSGYSVN